MLQEDSTCYREEHGRSFAQQPASSFTQGYHLAVDKSVREAHIDCVVSTL